RPARRSTSVELQRRRRAAHAGRTLAGFAVDYRSETRRRRGQINGRHQMERTIVEVEELGRSFGEKVALDRVSFTAEIGKVHGLVGANGAGKTTLLKHLLGLLRAQTGSVRV